MDFSELYMALLYLCMVATAHSYLFKSTHVIPRMRRFPTRGLNLKLPATLPLQPSVSSFNMEMAVPKAKAPQVKMIEDATPVYHNSIIEFYHDKVIAFGNFISKSPDSHSISVRLSSGEVATIDVAQIVSVWDGMADEIEPTTAKVWKNVLTEAESILASIPERKKDLSEFWELTSHQRSKNMAVDSFDVGVYLFQESKMRAWMSPRWGASESKVCSLSTAERVAAAMLIHRDHFHFKRRVSTMAPAPTNEKDVQEGDWYVIEGGYKLVTESVLDFKECDTFVQYYHAQTSDKATRPHQLDLSSVEEQIINRILCTLETYALGKISVLPSSTVKSPFTGKMVPRRGVPTVPQVPKAVRGVLNRLHLPVNVASARAVLMKLGQQGTEEYAPVFKQLLEIPREEILKGNILFFSLFF